MLLWRIGGKLNDFSATLNTGRICAWYMERQQASTPDCLGDWAFYLTVYLHLSGWWSNLLAKQASKVGGSVLYRSRVCGLTCGCQGRILDLEVLARDKDLCHLLSHSSLQQQAAQTKWKVKACWFQGSFCTRSLVEEKTLEVVYAPTEGQWADFLTMPTPKQNDWSCCRHL